jgi:methionyl-tRNA synthetase
LTRYNADLANGLGNLASRVLTMIEKYCGGQIPDPGESKQDSIVTGKDLREKKENVLKSYDEFQFARAIDEIWRLITEVDQVITEQKPWKLSEDPTNHPVLHSVLRAAAETLRLVIVLAHPVIPDATQKIWEQLGQPGRIEDVRIDQLQWVGLKPGTRIGKPEAVYPRVDKEDASERIAQMEEEIRNPGSTQPAGATTPSAGATGAGGAAAAAAPAPGTKIGIEDFAKVEMRVGIVKSAEKVAGADKLLKVMVDIGDEVRQVLAGIAQHYVPEELVGRRVVVVANMAPRKMRGQESNGMIVAASVGPEGRPVLCTFTEDVPAGARLK